MAERRKKTTTSLSVVVDRALSDLLAKCYRNHCGTSKMADYWCKRSTLKTVNVGGSILMSLGAIAGTMPLNLPSKGWT